MHGSAVVIGGSEVKNKDRRSDWTLELRSFDRLSGFVLFSTLASTRATRIHFLFQGFQFARLVNLIGMQVSTVPIFYRRTAFAGP